MLKKIGTLALLYGFFLSSASFTPVEEGVIAKNSYGERHVSGFEGKDLKVQSYSADQFSSLNDCQSKVQANHPKVKAEAVKTLCQNITKEALKTKDVSVEILDSKKKKTAKTL